MFAAVCALFALACMFVSFFLLRLSRRDLARAEKNLFVVKEAYRRRITIRSSDGEVWSQTLAQICERPTPDMLAPAPGVLVFILTDPERGTP